MSDINQRVDSLIIGIDVGSTTVKATVVNPINKEILWSDYLGITVYSIHVECVVELWEDGK